MTPKDIKVGYPPIDMLSKAIAEEKNEYNGGEKENPLPKAEPALELAPKAPAPKPKNSQDEVISKRFYITKKQFRAIKMRIAVSDKPEEKDQSALVRAAIDLYLAK